MTKRKKKIVSFKKVDGKWYCDIKRWPKALFAQTLMVGNASKLIEELSNGDDYVRFETIASNVWIPNINQEYIELMMAYSSLTGGAHYWIQPDITSETLWLCPVTLFVYKKYPSYIYFKRIS